MSASWKHSDTDDVLWGARKLVLTVASSMETVMDIIDPTGYERLGCDDGSKVIVSNTGEEFTILEFLYDWSLKLARANSAMREVADRVKGGGDGKGDAADLPD